MEHHYIQSACGTRGSACARIDHEHDTSSFALQGFLHYPTHCKNGCWDTNGLKQGSLPDSWAIRGRTYCFTDAIIEGARTKARKLIFGDADENIAYVHFVKEDLEKAGHHVEISFTTCKETMTNLDKIILAEEAQHRKDVNMDGILPADRKYFVLQWRKKHESKITNDWGLQQINSVLSFSMVYSLHPHLQKQLFLIYRKFSWLTRAI